MPTTIAGAPAGGRDSFAFIDLARLGRTDWWSGVKAFLRILLWQVLVSIPLAIALIFWRHALPPMFAEVAVLAGVTAGWLIGLSGAARKSLRRPLMSLVSPDLRLDFSRIALGAGFWLGANILITMAMLLVYALAYPETLARASGDFAWPSTEMLAAALLSIVLFPLQAAGEEMAFRGWMTQTLGQLLRRRWLVALVVAVAFALAHGSYHGLFALPLYIVMSLGLSALTLLDQRLELAIGAHAANNIFVVIASLFLTAHSARPTLFLNEVQATWSMSARAVVQFALIYAMARWLLRRREA
ncbi:MAG TPA: CPBP family glutamic-type intramembrane protease [Stellaceae bacterium]